MELLEILNPWWKEKSISWELALPYKRKVFPKIVKLLKTRQILVLSGLRRVGKSTLMYQLIETLLKNIKPQNILYFSFDERIKDPLEVLKKYSELTKVDWRKERCFIFFDEIQKLEGWSSKLKIIYDNFPNLKIIVSGSFHLESDAKSNLAGRYFLINIPPLSFTEYLEMRNSRIELDKPELWEDEIKKEFKSYLIKPFPEIVNFNEPSLIKSYIKSSIVDKILGVDLPKRFKDINEDIAETLIEMFYENPGSYINYDELSRDLKISKKTLIKHIYYLEFAYIIRRVKNFRPGIKIASRKLQRIYPFHFGLRFGWSGKVDFETAAASFLDVKYYWRENGREVDFLVIDKKITPVEVKESSKITRSDIAHLLYFMKKFNLKRGVVVYDGKDEKQKIDKYEIRKIPLWKLFLTTI